LLLVAIGRAVMHDAPEEGDRGTLFRFVTITIAPALVSNAAGSLHDAALSARSN
jgi:hypothetical protein